MGKGTKILYVNDFFKHAGAEHAMHDIANAALKSGYQAYFATTSRAREPNHFTIPAIHGRARFFLLRRTVFFNADPIAIKKFNAILRTLKPDIVHCHNLYHISPGIIEQAVKSSTACIVTFHEFWPICMNRTMLIHNLKPCMQNDWSNCASKCRRRKIELLLKPFVGRGFQKRRELLLKDGATLVSVSNFIKKTLARFGYPKERIEVIPNGVDTTYFTPPHKDLERRSVLYVGRGVESKGIFDFIKIARIYQKKYGKKLEFVAIGTGIESKIVKSIRWIPRSELLHYYRRALAFLQLQYVPPGTGLAPLESMACATPVVAYAVPGVEEYLTDGIDSYLAEPGNLDNVADVLENLRQNPEKSQIMGIKARERVEKFFSITENTRRYLELYSKVYQ
ncbi:glycosyltransferase family 4 protein [Candidatus Bathyarchaeota archaeon]|nr:glycosyltransferase family 4 protein [Candidatus Bathyarchaeota archaeon]